jgi:predicted nucleic acid-binding protein
MVAFLLDTNVAIHLRDGDPMVTQKVAALEGAVLISVVTRVELEGGVYWEPSQASIRRARLDAMLNAIPALAFDDLAAKTYEAIVASAGYSRRKLLDRMIAAQALVHQATVVTFNQDDFSDVPGLSSLVWRLK